MTGFTTDELISSTQLVRNFGSVLEKFKNNSVSKIGILKNNNVEAVIVGREEYEEKIEGYERLMEFFEDMQDIALVKERLVNDDSKRYSMEEVAKECGIDLNTI